VRERWTEFHFSRFLPEGRGQGRGCGGVVGAAGDGGRRITAHGRENPLAGRVFDLGSFEVIIGGHLSDADPEKCWFHGHELGKFQGELGQHLGQNHMKVKMADGVTSFQVSGRFTTEYCYRANCLHIVNFLVFGESDYKSKRRRDVATVTKFTFRSYS